MESKNAKGLNELLKQTTEYSVKRRRDGVYSKRHTMERGGHKDEIIHQINTAHNRARGSEASWR